MVETTGNLKAAVELVELKAEEAAPVAEPSLLDEVLANTPVATTKAEPPLPAPPTFVSTIAKNVKQNLNLVKVMQVLAKAHDRDALNALVLPPSPKLAAYRMALLAWLPPTMLPAGVTRLVRVNQAWFKDSTNEKPMLVSEDGGKTWNGYDSVEFLGASQMVAAVAEVKSSCGCGGSYGLSVLRRIDVIWCT